MSDIYFIEEHQSHTFLWKDGVFRDYVDFRSCWNSREEARQFLEKFVNGFKVCQYCLSNLKENGYIWYICKETEDGPRFLHKDGKIDTNTGWYKSGVEFIREAPGYWATREMARAFLKKWKEIEKEIKINWLSKEYIKQESQKGLKEALDCSILHWQQIVDAGYNIFKQAKEYKLVDMGIDYCSLCLRQEKTSGRRNRCDSCPLKSCGSGSLWEKVWQAESITKFEEAANNLLNELKKIRNESNYKIGDIFDNSWGDEEAVIMLCLVAGKVYPVLIGAYCKGEIWGGREIEVEDCSNITEKELSQLFDTSGPGYHWTRREREL